MHVSHEIQGRKLSIQMVYGVALWGSKSGIELVMRFKGSPEALDIVKGLQVGLNAVVNDTEVKLRPGYPSRGLAYDAPQKDLKRFMIRLDGFTLAFGAVSGVREGRGRSRGF